jgi:hypothetical protein
MNGGILQSFKHEDKRHKLISTLVFFMPHCSNTSRNRPCFFNDLHVAENDKGLPSNEQTQDRVNIRTGRSAATCLAKMLLNLCT